MTRRTQDAIFYGLAVVSGGLAGFLGKDAELWLKLPLVGLPLVAAALYRWRTYGSTVR